jgi:uncharacterized membrane protein
MVNLSDVIHSVRHEEVKALQALRLKRRQLRAVDPDHLSIGDRVSDIVAATVGSWRFIIIQSVLLIIWMVANVIGAYEHWDPYPFILLNLVLSFQAAYTAPIIMMSQNRQGVIDRRAAQHDYDINLKAELEIELLHHKIDLLREQEIASLTQTIRELSEKLTEARQATTTQTPP